MQILSDAVRRGTVHFPRGTLLRKACIGAIKAINPTHRLPPGLAEVRPLDRPKVSFEPTNSMVMDTIYWFGVQGYEGRMADVWESLCSEAQHVTEVGANVGLFTVLGGLATRGRYVAVEPVPEVVDVLRRNLGRNNLLAAIDVRHAAAIAGPVEATVEISIPDEGRDAPVGAHLINGSEVATRSSLRVVRVAGVPFRSLIEQADLIKIDAEGAEAELFRSAADHIARNRPTVVVEILPESIQLAAVIAEIAAAHEYYINVIPAFGSDKIITIDHAQFSAHTPHEYHSKDIVLSRRVLV